MTTWATFYLTCFFVGVMLSVLSFVTGSLRLPHLHMHLPHGQVAMPHVGGAGHAGAGRGAEFSYINFATITAFLTWFGGTGYLLTRHSTLIVAAITLIAIAVGLVGATIVFLFVVKFLLKHDRELDPADYDRVGVLGRISSPIRQCGTGEIIFSQAGSRHTCGARSEDGTALARGVEVIVTRYEHGIAYVRRWDELAERNATNNQ
jgi:membrane protein implicated in regulation of membrane protease activity